MTEYRDRCKLGKALSIYSRRHGNSPFGEYDRPTTGKLWVPEEPQQDKDDKEDNQRNLWEAAMIPRMYMTEEYNQYLYVC